MLHIGSLQLEYGTMLIQLICFLLLLWAVLRFAMKPMMRVLTKRQEFIDSQIQGAEESRKEAERLMEEQKNSLQNARKEAYDIIEQARATSAKQGEELIQSAKDESNRVKEAALSEIENEKKKAIAQLRSQVSGMSVMIASKIIEKQIDEKSQEDLVHKYLDEVGAGQ